MKKKQEGREGEEERAGKEREDERVCMRGCACKEINKHENMQTKERLIPSQ